MKNAIAKILVIILAGLLLAYSASRSLNFISLTLPADRQYLAWFGLAALDGGLVFWLLYFLHGANGAWQHATALLMVVVDLAGAVAMFTLDTLYTSGEAGLIASLTPAELRAAMLALSGVVALNVAATVVSHLADPETRKRQAGEEAMSRIEEAALRRISENAENLAAELAPKLAEDWAAATRARYSAMLGGGGGFLSLPAGGPEPVEHKRRVYSPARFGRNGKHERTYASEIPGFLAGAGGEELSE